VNKKVLVIDDEAYTLKMLESRLKAGGYDVVLAENGKEGLDKVYSEEPDLILLDILMPVMDGFEFFKIIKNDNKISDIPILVLTARSAMEDTFLSMDADDFVPKPFDPEELMTKVQDILSNKAIILSDDNAATAKLTEALEKYEYEIKVVEHAQKLAEEGKHKRYNLIIINLATLKRSPDEVMMSVRFMKNKKPKVIVYSDSKVAEIEANDTVAIDDIRHKWERLGVGAFYDARITVGSFGKIFETWITCRENSEETTEE